MKYDGNIKLFLRNKVLSEIPTDKRFASIQDRDLEHEIGNEDFTFISGSKSSYRYVF